MPQITSFSQCVSELERKQRLGVLIINLLAWLVFLLVAVATFGIVAGLAFLGWIISYFTAEVQVRKLQALGVTVSRNQLPVVQQAIEEVCGQFNIKHPFRVVVIRSGEANAFAIRFARKRVVLILSDLLEGIIDDPAQLRAIIGHELCHSVLDHGWRGTFELYKPAKYKQGRELTCDNAGLAAAGNLQAAKELLKKLCAGKKLHQMISEEALVEESRFIESGIAGWFVKQKLTHPPAGKRLANLVDFSNRQLAPASA